MCVCAPAGVGAGEEVLPQHVPHGEGKESITTPCCVHVYACVHVCSCVVSSCGACGVDPSDRLPPCLRAVPCVGRLLQRRRDAPVQGHHRHERERAVCVYVCVSGPCSRTYVHMNSPAPLEPACLVATVRADGCVCVCVCVCVQVRVPPALQVGGRGDRGRPLGRDG
jgi:hypothetical protein